MKPGPWIIDLLCFKEGDIIENLCAEWGRWETQLHVLGKSASWQCYRMMEGTGGSVATEKVSRALWAYLLVKVVALGMQCKDILKKESTGCYSILNIPCSFH